MLEKRKDEIFMKANEKRYIAIYARKSKLTNVGESIKIQIEKCENYIRAQPTFDDTTKIKVYQDEGFSGGNTDRPDFQRLLSDCINNKVSVIVCYRLDRVSRSVADFSQLYQKLEEHDTQFVSITEAFDTSTPLGKGMLHISMTFAQMERETITMRIRDNMIGLAKTGRWLGGTRPLGYRSIHATIPDTLNGKVHYYHKLETVPEEELIYQTLVDKYFDKKSLTAVSTFSHQAGLKTRNDKYFSTYALRQIFTNPVYASADLEMYNYFKTLHANISMDVSAFDGKHGLMVYNKTKQVNGSSHQQHPTDEWIVSIGEHKPFLTGKQWLALQELIENSKKRAYRQPRKNDALLSGFIRCANCNSFMRPKNYNRVDENGKKVYAYLCSEKEISKGKNCNMKNPRGSDVDYFVCEELKKLCEDKGSFMQQLNTIEKELTKESSDSLSEINLLRKNIKDIEKRINTLIQNLSQTTESITSQYINEEIQKLHSKKLEIEQQITTLETIENDKPDVLHELSSLQQKLSEFSTILDEMSIDDKRNALRKLVKTILWDGNTIHLYLTGSETPDSCSDIYDIPEPIGADCK